MIGHVPVSSGRAPHMVFLSSHQKMLGNKVASGYRSGMEEWGVMAHMCCKKRRLCTPGPRVNARRTKTRRCVLRRRCTDSDARTATHVRGPCMWADDRHRFVEEQSRQPQRQAQGRTTQARHRPRVHAQSDLAEGLQHHSPPRQVLPDAGRVPGAPGQCLEGLAAAHV